MSFNTLLKIAKQFKCTCCSHRVTNEALCIVDCRFLAGKRLFKSCSLFDVTLFCGRGMSADDIDISVSGNVLTIRGEKKESVEEEREDFFHCERRFGTFTRSIELPSTADLDSISASQNDGVLTVEVQKLPTAQPKKIDVKIPKRELAGSAR